MVAQWLALSLQQSSRGFDAYLRTFFVEFCDVLSCDEPATCPGWNWLSPEGISSVWNWVLKRMDGPQSHDSTILFAAGQRILRYCSDVLETVVLVNPSEEAAVSEVNDLQAPPTPPGFTLTQQCGSSWVPFCEKNLCPGLQNRESGTEQYTYICHSLPSAANHLNIFSPTGSRSALSSPILLETSCWC